MYFVPPPNAFYYIALLIIWPIVAYKIFKRYRLDRATILLFLVPYLFLPVPHPELTPIKLPLLPKIDKQAVPIFVALALFLSNKIKLEYLPRYRLAKPLCLLALLYPIATFFGNQDPLVYGSTVIPGMRVTEAASTFLACFLLLYVPFVVGFTLLRSKESHIELVRMIFVLGACYSLFALYEIRMSPQLHKIFYGYFPHDWRQMLRDGGFRPVVFLGHGLLVAFFCCLTTICAFVLWREKDPLVKGKGFWLFLLCAAALVLCKTYSAIIYFMFFIAATIFLGPKMRVRLAAAIAIIVLSYPILRSNIPLVAITEFFSDINPERAWSLQYRFNNEDMLLDKAMEKKWFGWGIWGRNRVYHPETGRDLSITDGIWIIYFGSFGWAGYIGVIGLLVYPIIAIWRIQKHKSSELTVHTYTLVFILALYLIDQIPNASMNHLTFLIAGALLGRAKSIAEAKESITTENPQPA